MVKRWKVTEPGTTPGREPPVEVVLASDYDAMDSAATALGNHVQYLEAENAKMRAEYPYLAECLRLQARVAVLEAALTSLKDYVGMDGDLWVQFTVRAALAPPTGPITETHAIMDSSGLITLTRTNDQGFLTESDEAPPTGEG